MLGRILRKIGDKIRRSRQPRPDKILPLKRQLPLPSGITQAQLRAFLASVHPAGAPAEEMARYCQEDFERFILTWHMTEGLSGKCLELGASPYFMTMLLRRFRTCELTLANYFSPQIPTGLLDQEVCFTNWQTNRPDRVVLMTHHFNMEKETFPFANASFDVVLFCEILEHLLDDPLRPLLEIGRVLKPGGTLLLTTPNVCRLENVARLIAGENIYDPYSGHGAYGRHNREYTLAELRRLLQHAGYTIDEAFSADVHANRTNHFVGILKLLPLVDRAADLGQYLFVKARNDGKRKTRKPGWLYRSYPAREVTLD
jgi:SAM-dependent methyltransferase